MSEIEPLKLEDLNEQAIKTIKQSMESFDKDGNPTKVALDASKFVYSMSSAQKSGDYKDMLQEFRTLIRTQRNALKAGEPLLLDIEPMKLPMDAILSDKPQADAIRKRKNR